MAGAPGPRAGALLRATCVLCRAAHPTRAHSCFGWALCRARLCICITSRPSARKVSTVHLPRDCADQTSPTGVRFKGGRARKGAGSAELRRPPLGRPPVEAGAGARGGGGGARSASACSCGSTNSTGQCTRGAPRENAREQSGAGPTEWDDEAAEAAATRACCWNDSTNGYNAWQWEYIRC